MARSTFALFAASAATVLALSGCSFGSPETTNTPSATPTESSDAQSTLESCLTLQDAVEDEAAALPTAYAEIQTDPAAALAKVQALADALDAGAAEVSDEAVRTAAEDASDNVNEMVDMLEVALADPTQLDLAAFQTSATAVQTSFTTIGEICG